MLDTTHVHHHPALSAACSTAKLRMAIACILLTRERYTSFILLPQLLLRTNTRLPHILSSRHATPSSHVRAFGVIAQCYCFLCARAERSRLLTRAGQHSRHPSLT